MIIDLPGGRRLVLAAGGFGWPWLVVGVVALSMLCILYREERRLVPRRVGLSLLGLRLSAALVLVTALFEPIAARSFQETQRGRVVVAVDVSESMATADPTRDDEERARLERNLGLSGADQVETMSRLEVCRRLLTGRSGLLTRLATDHEIEIFTFDRETDPATPRTLEDSLNSPTSRNRPSRLGTDWLPALREASKSSDERPIVAAVLLTDGRRDAPEDPGPTLDRLASRGIPVFPVLVGSFRPPRDVAVARVKSPASVYKGDFAQVDATLKLDGYEGREAIVTLERPGSAALRQTVRAEGESARPVVSFRVPMEETGAASMTVGVAPLEGDARPDNDRASVEILVLDDEARVLVVEGEARWEFRYLRNALERDPRVAVETVVFHQPKPGLTAEPVFTYGTALPSRSRPETLEAFDAIVVGDVSPEDAPPEFWRMIEAYVSDRGGTLVFSPGPRHGSSLGADDVARKLLPVIDPRALEPDEIDDPSRPGLSGGTHFMPVQGEIVDAAEWPMLQLAIDPAENLRLWSELPRLPWVIDGRAKPSATMLATSASDGSTALLAGQPYGLGKVLWIGTDATWRWRRGVGDLYHHRFWGQVVRWAARGKLDAGNAFVRFGPVERRARQGRPVRIQARIAEGVKGVSPDSLIAARISTTAANRREVGVVPLRASSGRPRTFEGVAPSLPPGSYAIRLDAPGLVESLDLEPDPPEATLEIAADDGAERVELAASREQLDPIANATGGRVIEDFEANILPDLLHGRTRTLTRTEETALWDRPASLLLFLTIVIGEWLARKHAGLP